MSSLPTQALFAALQCPRQCYAHYACRQARARVYWLGGHSRHLALAEMGLHRTSPLADCQVRRRLILDGLIREYHLAA